MDKSANKISKKSSVMDFWLFLAFFLGTACVIAFVTGGVGTVSSGASPSSAVTDVLTAPR